MTQRPIGQQEIGAPRLRSESAALRLRDWLRATGQGPLRHLWAAAYRAAQISVAAWLRHGAPDVTVYVRGSFGEGRPTYGFSDLDFVAITSDEPGAARLQQTKADSLRKHPAAAKAMDLAVLNGAELLAATTTPFYCRPATRLKPGEPALSASLGLNFFNHLRPWLRIGGPNRQVSGEIAWAHRPQWTWLEVQFRWKHLLRAVTGAHDSRQASHVASGALAGLARAAVWMDCGQSGLTREEAVERAAGLVPECAHTLERVLSAALEPDEVLPPASMLTQWVAGRIEDLGGEPDSVEVTGAASNSANEAALFDWRALTFPRDAGELLIATAGSAGDPAQVRAEASTTERRRTAILDGRLLAMPIRPGSPADARSKWAWQLRAMQCAVSDPVSWAVAAGRSRAAFRQHAGWSLQDWYELSARLLAGRLEPASFGAAGLDERIAVLFAASRTAALGRSIVEGRPALAVSLEAATKQLEDRHPRLRNTVEAAAARVRGEGGPINLEAWRALAAEELVQTSLASLARSTEFPQMQSLTPHASPTGL